MNQERQTKNKMPVSGIIGVVGRTNAGKSTLVNRIIGEKVSIVSPVVQTTRAVIRGILTDKRGQLVLLDTPGLHKSRNRLASTMNKRARAASEGVDAVLLVVDASQSPQLEDDGWMRRLAKSDTPVVIALNKSDKFRKADKVSEFKALWEKIADETDHDAAHGTARDTARGRVRTPPLFHVVSAAAGDAVDELTDALFSLLPPGELLFDEDTLSDYPKKLAVADIVREYFFLTLKDELPHSVGVIVESVNETAPTRKIEATVLVKRQTHKGIVIGSGGRGIRDAQKAAAKELAEFFGAPVTVSLRVKVEPAWDENPHILRRMGFA